REANDDRRLQGNPGRRPVRSNEFRECRGERDFDPNLAGWLQPPGARFRRRTERASGRASRLDRKCALRSAAEASDGPASAAQVKSPPKPCMQSAHCCPTTAPFIRGKRSRLATIVTVSHKSAVSISGMCGQTVSEKRTPPPTTWQTTSIVR